MSSRSNNSPFKAKLSLPNLKPKLPIWNDIDWIKKINRMTNDK